MTIENNKITIEDIQRQTFKYGSFIADNIPTDRQDYYYNILYTTINNLYTLLINSSGKNKNLEQETANLKEKLKSIKKEIDSSVSNAWDSINEIETIDFNIK